ncbi:MAG: type II toxin-antitoxin system Phd/YefM family antitoxin [Gaiellaceae bacterium]
MLTVSVTEAKNKLSALLARVKAGETVVITERGIPVARVEPAVPSSSEDDEARLARLERKGIIKRAKRPLSRELLETRPPAGTGKSIVDTLLEEREEGW